MADRKRLIVANWKQHENIKQASILVHRLQERIDRRSSVEVVLCPTFLAIQPLKLQVDAHKFKLGAQDAFYEDTGPYTGEVSAAMLRGLVDYVIVGHSDRRYKFGETDDIVAKKVAAVVRNDLSPILCVGETSSDRANSETAIVLNDQLTVNLTQLTSDEVQKLVIAYEPVWAIGTGDFAKPEQAKSASDIIRGVVKELYGPKAASQVRVLYGGSVTSHNSQAYLDIDGIDGLLVGGASLNYEEFGKIVASASADKK